jgi:hypothetical protein
LAIVHIHMWEMNKLKLIKFLCMRTSKTED